MTYEILWKGPSGPSSCRFPSKRVRFLCILGRRSSMGPCRRDLDHVWGTLKARLDDVKGMKNTCDVVGSKGGDSAFKVTQGHLVLRHVFRCQFNYAHIYNSSHGRQGKPSQRYYYLTTIQYYCLSWKNLLRPISFQLDSRLSDQKGYQLLSTRTRSNQDILGVSKHQKHTSWMGRQDYASQRCLGHLSACLQSQPESVLEQTQKTTTNR